MSIRHLTSKIICDIIITGGDVKYMTKDTRERFTFRIPSALMQRIRDEAMQEGVSINALILKILWDWAENNKPA